MDIPAGYQLHAHSWENDGDSRKTEVLSGLSMYDVLFLIEIISHFQSKNSHANTGRKLGNSEVRGMVLVELLNEALEHHPNISQQTRERFTIDQIGDDFDEEDAGCTAYEAITQNLLGHAEYEGYDGLFCRVCDDFDVFYVETPIREVTDKFR